MPHYFGVIAIITSTGGVTGGLLWIPEGSVKQSSSSSQPCHAGPAGEAGPARLGGQSERLLTLYGPYTENLKLHHGLKTHRALGVASTGLFSWCCLK